MPLKVFYAKLFLILQFMDSLMWLEKIFTQLKGKRSIYVTNKIDNCCYNHLIFRFFWFCTLIFCSFCAYLVFSDQLKRYNENPTVLSIEILSEGEFDRPAFTICTISNYIDEFAAEEIIEK